MADTVERRSEPRRTLRWPVAIVIDSGKGQTVARGVTQELSLSGVTMLTETNVVCKHPVDLLLFLPAASKDAMAVTLQVKAKIISTVLSNRHQQFVCSLRFDKFAGTGQATLEKLLK